MTPADLVLWMGLADVEGPWWLARADALAASVVKAIAATANTDLSLEQCTVRFGRQAREKVILLTANEAIPLFCKPAAPHV